MRLYGLFWGRRIHVWLVLVGLGTFYFGQGQSVYAQGAAMTIENEYAKYVMGADGHNLHFIDRRTGVDYCAQTPKSLFAWVKKGGKEYGASAATHEGGLLTVQFGESGVSATIKVIAQTHFFVFEVSSLSGEG